MGPTPQGLPALEGLPYAHGGPVSQCHPGGVPHAWTWSYVNPHLHLFLFLRDCAAPLALPHCHLGVDQMPQRVPKTQTYGVIPGPHGWAPVPGKEAWQVNCSHWPAKYFFHGITCDWASTMVFA